MCVCVCVSCEGAGCVYPHHIGEGMHCKSLMCVYSVLADRPLITAAHKMRNSSLLQQMTGVRPKQKKTDPERLNLATKKKQQHKTRHKQADDGISLFQPL